MKSIKNIISFIMMSMVLIACEDKGLDNIDWLKEPNFDVPMTLTSSSESVVMNAGNDDENAITFTWTPGNERGAGTTLKYIFLMDIVGNNFGEQTALVEEMPEGVFTKSYSVGELNSLLLKKFKRPGAVETKLEVQIIARVDNSIQFQKPEIAKTTFNATAFSPGPLPLFMVGDAISGGWNYNLGISLPEITERTVYNYAGNFSVGAFKIIEKLGDELPSYDPNAANSIVYNTTEARTTDNVFKVTQTGRHNFYMDLAEKAYYFGYVPYEKVYMVGQAVTGTGWDIINPKQMSWNPKNPEVFTFIGSLETGEMKLPLETGNWGGQYLMPIVNGTVINGDVTDVTTMHYMPNGSIDNKWVIQTAGDYEITVNPAKMTIVFKKL